MSGLADPMKDNALAIRAFRQSDSGLQYENFLILKLSRECSRFQLSIRNGELILKFFQAVDTWQPLICQI